MGCFSKTMLFGLNLFVLLVGGLVVVLASLVIHRSSVYTDMLFDGVLTLPVITLLVGLAIAILGFFGCCGALKENRCMLYSYAGVVLVLFIGEIVLGILILTHGEEAKDLVHESMKKSFDKYGGPDETLTKSIDAAQHELGCCGVDGYQYWLDRFGNGSVTPGCCLEDHIGCNENISSDPEEAKTKIHIEGCFTTLVEELEGITVWLGISAIVLGLIQVSICNLSS